MERNLYIDGLRTVAILLVVVSHMSAYLPTLTLRPNTGYYGVSLFFVVSGYLITSGAIRRYGSLTDIKFRQFYLFRISRIGPGLFLLAVLNVTLLFCHVPGFELLKSGPDALPELLFYVFTFQANIYGVQGYLPNAWGVLWSLAIEEVFYLCFPLICIFCRPRRVLILFLCLVIVDGPAVRWWLGIPGIYSYFGCFDQLAIGCLTAIMVSSRTWSPTASASLQIAGVITCVMVYLLISPLNVIGPTAMAVGAAIFVAGSSRSPMTWSFPTFLTLPGQWSYELYLFHHPILKVLGAMGVTPWILNYFGNDYSAFAALAVIVGISGLISVFLLSPASRWVRQFTLAPTAAKVA